MEESETSKKPDKYDIAAKAAPLCIAVQHIAALWKEISRSVPEVPNNSCLININSPQDSLRNYELKVIL
jgi:hypothetical protein